MTTYTRLSWLAVLGFAFVLPLAALTAGCGDDSGGDHRDAGADAGEQTPADAGPKDDAGPGEVRACGGFAGLSCPSRAQYCELELGACQTPDAAGHCVVRPELCGLELMPVCGCDRVTYSNPCAAASAGVNVLYEGECRAEPR